MTITYLIIGLVSIHFLRWLVMKLPTPKKNHEDFEGRLIKIGKSIVGYEAANIPSTNTTIVCMHGWLEDHRYFTDLYSADDGELILVNSCRYYGPNITAKHEPANWQVTIDFPECTIEYDASILISAIENLATKDKLVLHGHSRGGAVILEAIKQRPELFKHAEVILEAAILPETRIGLFSKLPSSMDKVLTKIVYYPFPFIAALLARRAFPKSMLKNMGPLNNRKIEVLSGLFNNASSAEVLVKNIYNILDWPTKNSTEIFDSITSGHFLIGSSDGVLSRKLMIESANKNKGNLKVILTKESSHFVSLDLPEQVKNMQFL